MKKILFLALLFALNIATFAQSVTIDPSSEEMLDIKTGENIPGFIHQNTDGTVKMGIVAKNGGAYLQTFTNTALSFAVNNGFADLSISTQHNVEIANYTQLNTDAPFIKLLKLNGYTDSYNPAIPSSNDGLPYFTVVAHGLNPSKILSMRLIYRNGSGVFFPQEYTVGNQRVGVFFNETHIFVYNYPNESIYALNKIFTILISYEK